MKLPELLRACGDGSFNGSTVGRVCVCLGAAKLAGQRAQARGVATGQQHPVAAPDQRSRQRCTYTAIPAQHHKVRHVTLPDDSRLLGWYGMRQAPVRTGVFLL